MSWTEAPFVRCEAARSEGDCAIVALSLLTGWHYDDVLAVAGSHAPFPHRNGLYTSQIIKIAKVWDLHLKRSHKIDLENGHGILEMWCQHNRMKPGWHVALLRWGLIFDGVDIWEPETFLQHYGATIKLILVPYVKKAARG